jgi:Zn-finger nucleic acid-binding protein
MSRDDDPATYIVATPNLCRPEADPRDENNKPDDFDYDGPLPQWWLVSAAGSTVNFVAITYCPFCGEDLNADLLGEDWNDDSEEDDWAGDEEENGTEMGPCPRCQGVLKNIGKDLVCTGDCKTIWWCEPLTQPTLGDNDFRFLSPGGECPACRNGTIHIHTSSKGAESATCMGECGGIWHKRYGIWRSAMKKPHA